jgi:hypothetical protein
MPTPGPLNSTTASGGPSVLSRWSAFSSEMRALISAVNWNAYRPLPLDALRDLSPDLLGVRRGALIYS